MRNFMIAVFLIVLSTILFTILFSEAQRGIRIEYPKGSESANNPTRRGETFYVGDTVKIRWTNTGVGIPSGKVWIFYTPDYYVSNWIPIECVENTGHYLWKVPDVMTATAKIRLERRQQCDFPILGYSVSGFFIISPVKVLGSTISMSPSEIQDGQKINSIEFDVQNLTDHPIKNLRVRILEPSTKECTGMVQTPDNRNVNINQGIQHIKLNGFSSSFKKPTGNERGLTVLIDTTEGGLLSFGYKALIEIRPGFYKLAQ